MHPSGPQCQMSVRVGLQPGPSWSLAFGSRALEHAGQHLQWVLECLSSQLRRHIRPDIPDISPVNLYRWLDMWWSFLLVLLGFMGHLSLLPERQPASFPRITWLMPGAVCLLDKAHWYRVCHPAHGLSFRKEIIVYGLGLLILMI